MGAYTEIVDFTFTANETSRTFSGLSITKDDFIRIDFTHVNPIASDSPVNILGNSTVSSNYHRQFLSGNGSSVFAGRNNFARTIFTLGSSTSASICYLKLSENDRLNTFTNFNETISNNLATTFNYTTSSGATFTSGITSLTFECETTNGLGTGSRIQIYRLDAVKEADITVTSNTTQVDISNLSIDKDSEYLLVSDVVNPTGSFSGYYLTPNDLTTNSNYYYQRILGDGGSASAERFAEARIGGVSNGGRAINYTHIKLSNIGAFTFQSYGLLNVGSSSIALVNYFVSSIAENFTTITKLNNIFNVANAIGTGSRFILYKLYE